MWWTTGPPHSKLLTTIIKTTIMKKSLLFAALFMGAMSINAQEYVQVNAEAAGITGDAAAVAAGTTLGSTDNVTMKIAYDDNYKSTQIAFNDYDQIEVNGTTYDLVTGVTGSTNPSGQALSADGSTAPTAGCVFQFDVKKDGYLTVFGKMSSNKEYYVWEGDAVSASPMAYTFAMDFSAAADDSKPSITYTLPSTELGYVNFDDANIATYLTTGKIKWPEQIAFGDDSAIKKNGVGVISFPVFAEAGTYLVHAAGSKMSTCGAVFTTEPVSSIKVKSSSAAAADKTIYVGDASGISSTSVEKTNANAPIYNLAGQRVSNSFKGIAIQNGKKFIK